MALAASFAKAGFNAGVMEERESGSGFEFTRRKKWPQLLLQELVGAVTFCLKPHVPAQQANGSGEGGSSSRGGTRWRVVYVSPSVTEMLGQKPGELENRDFFELVFGPDHTQLQTLFSSLISTPPPLLHNSSSSSSTTPSSHPAVHNAMPTNTPHALGRSHTTYARLVSSQNETAAAAQNRASIDSSANGVSGQAGAAGSSGAATGGKKAGPSVWELRAHATGIDAPAGYPAFGLGGAAGTMVPHSSGSSEDAGFKGKAVWVMARRAGENNGEEGSVQTLDAFLELKLENERLREELRELQIDIDEDDYTFADPPAYAPSPSTDSDGSDSGSRSSSPGSDTSSSGLKPDIGDPTSATRPDTASGLGGSIKKKPGRPPKDRSGDSKDKDAARERKKQKKASLAAAGGLGGLGGAGGAGAAGMVGLGGAGGLKGEEGSMHVCVTCGRTDSPEWRKGPLGPKTLCNACGLRWAKRNSTQPSRKEKKAMQEMKK